MGKAVARRGKSERKEWGYRWKLRHAVFRCIFIVKQTFYATAAISDTR